MRSYTQKSFWDTHRRLPEHVKRQAREAYRFFASNPEHPSLDFKKARYSDFYTTIRQNPAVTRQRRRLSRAAQAFSLRGGRSHPPWADRNVLPHLAGGNQMYERKPLY